MLVPVEGENEEFKKERIEALLKDFFETTLETIQEETAEGALKETTVEAILIDFEDVLSKIPGAHFEIFRPLIEKGIQGLYIEEVKQALIKRLNELAPMAQNPEKGKGKTPAEKRKDFFDSRLPELLKEPLKPQEARRKLGEIMREASDSFVLTRGMVRDISGRDQILKELFEEFDKLKISEEDREKYFIENKWTNRKKEKKHQLFLRNDIAVQLSGKTVTFNPEEVVQMQNFILQIRALQDSLNKKIMSPYNPDVIQPLLKSNEQGKAEEVKREKEKKERVLKETVDIINTKEDPYKRVMEEASTGAVKILEKKTGRSLEFSPDEYSLIQKHVNERFADIMAARAEDYLRRKKSEVLKRGIDPEAKGAAALQAVENLGVTKEIIEGDRELEKIHTVLTALSEFSRSDIPPSARFAVLEQLNQLPDSEELRKLRIEVFQKWSGREPEIDPYALELQARNIFYNEVLPQREEAIRRALSDEERRILTECRIAEDHGAYLKALGYQFRPLRTGFFSKVILRQDSELRLIKERIDVPFSTISESEARTQWINQVKAETENQIRERVKSDLSSEFVSDVTDISPSVLKKRYEGLRHDIDTEYTRKIVEGNKKGEKITEEADEALAETGKGSMQFIRSMVAGEGAFGSLSGDVEKDRVALLNELKSSWDLDIPPEQFDRFVKESGMDYNFFSKKRQGLAYFMLSLISHALQEAKKINI